MAAWNCRIQSVSWKSSQRISGWLIEISVIHVKSLRPTNGWLLFSSLVGGWLQDLSLQQTGQWHWSWTSVFLLWRHPFKLRSEIFNQLWNKNTSLLPHLPFTKFQLVPKGPHGVMVFDFFPRSPCMLMHELQLELPIRCILVVKRLGPRREAKCFWPLLCPAVIIAWNGNQTSFDFCLL